MAYPARISLAARRADSGGNMDFKVITGAVRARWLARPPRERRWLLWLAALLGLLLLFEAAWRPLHARIAQQRGSVAQLEAGWRHMQRMRAEAQQLARTPPIPPLPATALLPIVQHQAQRLGVPLEGWRFMPDGAQLKLSGTADFDRWLSLAAALETQSRLRWVQLSVQAGDVPGQVRIEAALQHGGG